MLKIYGVGRGRGTPPTPPNASGNEKEPIGNRKTPGEIRMQKGDYRSGVQTY